MRNQTVPEKGYHLGGRDITQGENSIAQEVDQRWHRSISQGKIGPYGHEFRWMSSLISGGFLLILNGLSSREPKRKQQTDQTQPTKEIPHPGLEREM